MIVDILLDVAGKVAAPFVKKALGNSDLAGGVIDIVAKKLGMPIDKAKPEEIEKAVVAAEPEAAELVLAHVESQRLANELALAEINAGGPTWTWAWRPFGMWLFLAMMAHLVFLVPLLNIVLTSPLILVLDIPTFVTLFLTYSGLYMGGHTAKKAVEMWRAK
jgi:hypothetical protein